ncbi:MAG: hypothetical protein FJ398_06875 [Verrucomicrobia bacterium]|nr:hypothetical protein [Verrucomicrobiota bacterium]
MWTYVSGQNEPPIKPDTGQSGSLEWAWSTVPASPVSFTYTVRVPTGETGEKTITAKAIYREAGQRKELTPPQIVLKASTTTPNRPPNQPTNASPANGASNIPLILTLTGGPFSDPDVGDVHTASQWLIRRSSDGKVVFDSGEDKARLTGLTVFPSLVPDLAFATRFAWQVRYKDNHDAWSDFSVPTTFTTQEDSNKPPAITLQPQSQTVASGTKATFTVQASGNPPLTYQWQKNGAPISGATGSTITLANVAATDAGEYSVIVSNSIGQTTSANATLTVNPVIGGPANDNFINRIKLTGASVSVEGSNVNATKETAEPNHASKPGGKSVWWSWTAPQDGTVIVSTAGSSIDTLLAVYTGSSPANLMLVKSNDDDEVNGGSTSLLTFLAQAGTEYQIAVDAFGGEAGAIKLTLQTEAARAALRVEVSGKNILLSWPSSAAGFIVEVSDSLASPNWTPASLTPVVTGETTSAKIPILSGSKFYRLRGR